ncbi:hypothetical protein AAG906_019603 [Vitis piasezkii]
MFFNGIDQSYHTWYWHGEVGPTSRQPTEMAQCYDTMDCGDVASTVEMVHVIDDEFMTDPISFKNCLKMLKNLCILVVSSSPSFLH